MKTILVLAAALVLAGCTGIPPSYVSSGNQIATTPREGSGYSPYIDPNANLRK